MDPQPPPLSKIPAFWQAKYRREAGKSWNLFYKRNETRFFKDRHWYRHEFPELHTPQSKRILEVGCGVGNFILPLLADPETAETIAHAYMTDFSPRAIELLQADPRYREANARERATAFVSDLCDPAIIRTASFAGTIDLCTAIFVLSAIPPEHHHTAFGNIASVLRPGGSLLLRDYAANDAAQLRFKEDRKLGDRLFVRQDGTLCYFFTAPQIHQLAQQNGLTVESCELLETKTTNHKKDLTVDRFFLQAKLTKTTTTPS